MRRGTGTSEDAVRMALFYDYTDAKHTVADSGLALAMTQQLQKLYLSANVQTCGFKIEKSEPDTVTLVRSLKIKNELKKIHLTVASTSLTRNDFYNRDLQKGYWDQKLQTERSKMNFHAALKDSEVVFYSGHARRGGGPGFSPTTLLTGTLETKKRESFRKMPADLRSSQSQLKFLGYFACESQKYYSKEILSAAPHLGLIVTEKEINSFDSEQSTLAALNSLLGRKCENEFADSLTLANHPEENVTKLQNFFKQNDSVNKSSTSNLKSSSLQ